MAFIITRKTSADSSDYRRVIGDGPTAERLRAFADGQGINIDPLDVEQLALALGIKVVREDADDDDSFSGCIEKRGDEFFIVLNRYHNVRRQRFTLAHELAHFVLHSSDIGNIGREAILMRETLALTQREREANQFAGDILMPKEAFLAQIRRGMTSVESLADYFQVSIPAVKYRAINLGLYKGGR